VPESVEERGQRVRGGEATRREGGKESVGESISDRVRE